METQSKSKSWYKKWWVILPVAIMSPLLFLLIVIGATVDMDVEPESNSVSENAPTVASQNFEVIGQRDIGLTTTYYIYAENEYRNAESLKLIASEIFSHLKTDHDYIVNIYDEEMVADFAFSVRQEDWKRETAGRNDFVWVANHHFAQLVNVESSNSQVIEFYPDGYSGSAVEIN